MQYTKYDYPEHASHENGNYSNKCFGCSVTFTGMKNFGYCKMCSGRESKVVEQGTQDKSV